MNKETIDFEKNAPLIVTIQAIHKYPLHWHEGVTELILPLKGFVEVTSNFEQFNVQEGDFLFVNHNSLHSISSPSTAIVGLLHINLNFFENQFEHIKYMFFRSSMFTVDETTLNETTLNDSNFDDDIRREYKTRFRNLLINIFSDSINNHALPEYLLQKYEQQLIYALVYEFDWLQFLRKNSDFISSVQLSRYHRIVKFIDENYMEKITLDDIVAKEFITKNYLSHFWKKVSSYSFQERINYERVIKSQFFLLDHMNISKISERCGFSDVKYYYQAFKKWFGCMPLEHRAKCLKYVKEYDDYVNLECTDIKSILYNYVNSYFMVQCNYSLYPDISSSIDNYLKI